MKQLFRKGAVVERFIAAMTGNQALSGIRAPEICRRLHRERLEHVFLHELLAANAGDLLNAALRIVEALAGVPKPSARFEGGEQRLIRFPTPVGQTARVA